MKTGDRIIRWAIMVTFSGLLACSFVNVITRFINISINTGWTEEMARYFSVYVVFFGAALTTRSKAHPNVGILLTVMKKSHFGAKVARVLEYGVVILEIAVLLVVIVKGAEVSYLVWGQSSPASQISMTWPYLAIPLGGVMMLAYYKDYFRGGIKG